MAGIIGAGGNVGAVAAGFLLKGVGDVQRASRCSGRRVLVGSLCAVAVRFSAAHKATEQELYEKAVAERTAANDVTAPGASPRRLVTPVGHADGASRKVSGSGGAAGSVHRPLAQARHESR